jgi:ubiquinone/menaquinone biosynthesis C-methylase UbiE
MTLKREPELETLHSCDLCGSDQIEAVDVENCLCACRRCGYVFDNPRPAAREIAAFYSMPTKYDHWLSAESARDRLWKRRLRKMELTRKPGTLLDVGAGIGQFLHHARPYYSSVYGTEVSDTAVRIAREKYNLTILQGDLESLQFEESTFDNITLFHVLEHVPSPKSLVKRCRAMLTANGILVIAVPNDVRPRKAKIRALLRKLGVKRFKRAGNLGLRRITLDDAVQEIHLSHFTPDVLERFLAASGFSVLENTLDPYYADLGWQGIIQGVHYAVSSVLRLALRINLYHTIWIVARKT